MSFSYDDSWQCQLMILGLLVGATWQITETVSVPQEFLGEYQTEHDPVGKTYLTHMRIGSENLTHFLFKKFFLMAHTSSFPSPPLPLLCEVQVSSLRITSNIHS